MPRRAWKCNLEALEDGNPAGAPTAEDAKRRMRWRARICKRRCLYVHLLQIVGVHAKSGTEMHTGRASTGSVDDRWEMWRLGGTKHAAAKMLLEQMGRAARKMGRRHARVVSSARWMQFGGEEAKSG
ncbi:hypothetical protein B0H19DRAFT_1085843 [Mycena capillaripes]|nr:hypothetical protein B0H19DRAFT_1085843 [Mycena capillaripes]